MTGTLRWHSCSTDDFPLKRHKVSKACEACRSKKMRCDGKFPCQRCEHNKISCKYNDKPLRTPRLSSVAKQRQTTLIPTATPSSSSSSSCEANNRASIPSGIHSNAANTASATTTRTTTVDNDYRGICVRNDLFETIFSAHASQAATNSFTPPLLLDAFHITACPLHIWNAFLDAFNSFCSLHPSQTYDNSTTIQQMQSKNDLVKEAIKLFVTHNLLYGAFFRAQLLSFVVHSNTMYLYLQQLPKYEDTEKDLLPLENSSAIHTSPSQSPQPLQFKRNQQQQEQQQRCSSILFCSVLALTFGTAFQQQGLIRDAHKRQLLQKMAFMLYKRARQQFFEQCFSTDLKSANSFSPLGSVYLVQSSVLLAQFQSQIMNSSKQTFTMIHIGLSILKQAYAEHSQSQYSSYKSKTNNKHDMEIFDYMTTLSKILDAWRTWLSIYSSTSSIQSTFSTTRRKQSEELNNSSSSFQDTVTTKISFAHLTKKQNWALYILDSYNQFLKSILARKGTFEININATKSALKEIANMLQLNSGQDSKGSLDTLSILQLFHHTLTLQCYLPYLDIDSTEQKHCLTKDHNKNSGNKSRQDSPSTISSDSVLSLSTMSPSLETLDAEQQEEQRQPKEESSLKEDMHIMSLCTQIASKIVDTLRVLHGPPDSMNHNQTLISTIVYSASLVSQFLLMLQRNKGLMDRIQQAVNTQPQSKHHFAEAEETRLTRTIELFKKLQALLASVPSSHQPYFEALSEKLAHSNWNSILHTNNGHNSMSPAPSFSSKDGIRAVNTARMEQQQQSFPSASTTTVAAMTPNTINGHNLPEGDEGGSNAGPPLVAGLTHYVPEAADVMSHEIVVTDCNNVNMKIALDHMASVPPPRADIDKEQLEKLSSHRYPSLTQHSVMNQQLQMQQYQQYQQYQEQFLLQQQQQHAKQGIDSFTIYPQQQYGAAAPSHSTQYMFDHRYMPNAAANPFPTSPVVEAAVGAASQSTTASANNDYYFYPSTKRALPNQQLNEYQNYNGLHAQQPPSKRLRSDTMTSYEQFIPPTTHTGSNTTANQLQVGSTTSANTTDAALMYWMLDSETTGASFYQPSTTTTAPPQQQHQHHHHQRTRQVPMSKRNNPSNVLTHQSSPLLEHEATTGTENTTATTATTATMSGPLINNNHANTITKLPLPQPSLKSVTMPLKSWSSSTAHTSAQTWSKFFFASEVQTLHYQTPPLLQFDTAQNTNSAATATPFPIGLSVINEEGQHEEISPTTPGTTSLSSTAAASQHQQQQQRFKNLTYSNQHHQHTNNNNLHPQHHPSHHYHRHSIISDKSSISSHTSTASQLLANNSANATANTAVVSTSTEAAEAVAAAAAAVWVSTAAAVAAGQSQPSHQYHSSSNHQRYQSTSHRLVNGSHQGLTAQHPHSSRTDTPKHKISTGHWINSEKVEDDENWN